MQLKTLIEHLERIAPLRLAADWDNVGLLVGRPEAEVERVMTALDVTRPVLQQAIELRIDVLITHHPAIFRPLKRLIEPASDLLLTAIEHRIAIYSPHTAWDDCDGGINDQLASILSLEHVAPFRQARQGGPLTSGRIGTLAEPLTLRQMQTILSGRIDCVRWRANAPLETFVGRVAILCGSGGSVIDEAVAAGCDCLLTGEATYHQALQAKSAGVVLAMIGHFASERFGMVALAQRLASELPDLSVAPAAESDIIR